MAVALLMTTLVLASLSVAFADHDDFYKVTALHSLEK
jgi:hypothetical protein